MRSAHVAVLFWLAVAAFCNGPCCQLLCLTAVDEFHSTEVVHCFHSPGRLPCRQLTFRYLKLLVAAVERPLKVPGPANASGDQKGLVWKPTPVLARCWLVLKTALYSFCSGADKASCETCACCVYWSAPAAHQQ